jgi:Secretion system C-terminal sorting domain
MKNCLLCAFLFYGMVTSAQSMVQSINSGSVIAANSTYSVGEIIVNPVNPNQSSTGIIGILAQINAQLLEVSEFEISNHITVYPNPTQSMLYFQTTENLLKEKIAIYDLTGKLILQKTINENHTLDLSELASGQYLIQFQNKKYKSIQIIKK